MFTAVYLPSRPEGVEDPSRSGFATEEEAEEFVVSQMCDSCKEERRMALAGEKYEDAEEDYLGPSQYPGCFYEWLIGKTAEFESATSMDETMFAGGWEVTYRKENTPEQNAALQAAFEARRSQNE